MKLKAFVDFDGTITRQDVGNEFFRVFGGEICSQHVIDYKSGMTSAKKCFRRELAEIGSFDWKVAREFLRGQPLDGGFRNFAGFCHERDIELHIVSDGFDFYINEILALNGIEGVAVFCNSCDMTTVGDATVFSNPRFPHDDAECDRCACCKRNIMLTHSGDDDVILFVGEGYSDRCPAHYADIVFAKDVLQTYCQEQNISYYVYQSFSDVRLRIGQMLLKKRLPKRREAEKKRWETFLAEF